MVSIVNECGYRNDFGFFDVKSKEIHLKRPCFKKKEAMVVYEWLDEAREIGLKKFSMGVGLVENFVVDGHGDSLYNSARGVIKQAVEQTKYFDSEILLGILERLDGCKGVISFSLRCFYFENQSELFDSLMRVIKSFNQLVYLDLTGCYFSDEQLIMLAEVVSNCYISQFIWPELRMSNLVLNEVLESLKKNDSIVVYEGVPMEILQIAKRNRLVLLNMAKRPLLIKDEEVDKVRKYKASIKIAFSYEKNRLVELQKTLEAIIM